MATAARATARKTSTTKERLFDTIFGKHPSQLQVAERVESGLPVNIIDDLRDAGLTFGEVHTLVLPARTLKHRKQKRQPLSIEESDRMVRLTRILSLADEVFANHEKALGWLRAKNRQLEGRAPLDLLRSEAGGDVVRQMLHQIDEGIYV